MAEPQGAARTVRIQKVIALLNSIHVGEVSAIDGKLVAAIEEIRSAGETDMSALIEEARGHLGRADFGNFRRLVAQAVSRLGHLR